MSNAAVIQIIQHNVGAIGANNNSDFTVRLLNPDDYIDLRCLPGLAVTEWPRWNEDDAVDLAIAIGEILTDNRVVYRVEWP
jgi:hypothetical protein